MEENDFEKFPGSSKESEQVLPIGQDFEKAMDSDVPEFAGDEFGFKTGNEPGNAETVNAGGDENGQEYDAGIADAAALINYGLNAAARELGVELVVQKIKGFDVSGSEDPIGDFFRYLGINTPEERKDLREEGVAAKSNETEFRDSVNVPLQKRSTEGAFTAIKDMKELISEVEGADPSYEELRAEARAAGKGYFEYAVSNYGVRGLTELFTVLSQQREKSEEKDNAAFDSAEEDTEKESGDKEGDIDDKTGAQTLNPEILKKVA